MSYYNQPPYGGAPPPYGVPMQQVAPPGYPVAQGQAYSGYGMAAQPAPVAYAGAPSPYGQPVISPYPAQYAAQAGYMPAQQQYYQQQQYAQQAQPYGAQQPYGASPQGYPMQQQQQPQQLPQQQQQQQHYSHQIMPSVQMDTYGLPQIPGDVALQYPQTFKVEEKVMSATQDSFVVKDAQGSVRYKVDGSFTVHERKVLKDIHGQTLLKIREARLKMREKITISNASNVPILTLQKASAIQIGSKRVNGYLGGQTSGSPAIIITGNHNNTHFRVASAQNQEIANIRRRKFSIKNMLTDQDSYEVTVNVGSPALVCFIAVALDEIYED